MSNKKYEYSYNINANVNEKDFFMCCKLIEKGLPGILKEELLIDVDGSLIQMYCYMGKEIAVYDDYYVDAVYVDSNVNLEEIIGKKSVY